MKAQHGSIYLLTFLLVSCNLQVQDPKKIIEDIKKSTPNSIEKLPELTTYTPMLYTAYKVNDPFSILINQTITNKDPIALKIKQQSKRPDFDRPREYLENFSLDALVMVGTLKRKDEIWALIVDKHGILHKVKTGNYLGQNSGKIITINEEYLAVEEIVSDEQGGWTTRNATIKIQHK